MTAPNYVKLRRIEYIVCFQGTIIFIASKKSFSKFYLNYCVLHSIVNLFAVRLLSLPLKDLTDFFKSSK